MMEFHIKISPDGQAVLPQALCDSLSVKPGDEIVVLGERHDMRLYRSPDIARRMTALRELQRMAKEFVPPDVSVVDELLLDRRAEAAREEAEIKKILDSDKSSPS